MSKVGFLSILLVSFMTLVALIPFIGVMLVLSVISRFTDLLDNVFVIGLLIGLLFLVSSLLAFFKTLKIVLGKQTFKDQKPFTKILLFSSFPLLILIAIGVYYFVWSIKLEDYCQQKAQEIIKDKSNTLLGHCPHSGS